MKTWMRGRGDRVIIISGKYAEQSGTCFLVLLADDI